MPWHVVIVVWKKDSFSSSAGARVIAGHEDLFTNYCIYSLECDKLRKVDE
jgi:hypothetical protein